MIEVAIGAIIACAVLAVSGTKLLVQDYGEGYQVEK